MSENWIRVGRTNYHIKSDRLNWTVARRLKCKKTKSNPEGYKYADHSYHSSLSSAFQRVFDETVKLSEARTMQDILRVCEETYAMLREVLDYDFSEMRSSGKEKSAA